MRGLLELDWPLILDSPLDNQHRLKFWSNVIYTM